MTAREEAKLSMYRTVQQLYSNNTATVNANTAFATVMGLINTKVSTLITSETSAQKRQKA